jgi:DNA-binding CsgD family transcriptional regulator
MRTLANAAQVEVDQNNWREGLKKGLRAIELAERVDDPYAELNARWQVNIVLRDEGDTEGARQQLEKMLPLASRLRDSFWMTISLFQLAVLAQWEGNWEMVRHYCDRTLELQPNHAQILGIRTKIEYETGDFVQGKAYQERLLELARRIPPGPTTDHASVATSIAYAALISGVTDKLTIAGSASETILSSHAASLRVIASARQGLALQAILVRDKVQAQEQYHALVNIGGNVVHQGQARISPDRLLGLLCIAQGNLGLAIAHFEAALKFCHAGYRRPELAWSCHDYAVALLQRDSPGDHAKAKSLLEESRSIAGDLGMKPLIERVASLQEQAYSQPAKVPTYPDGLSQREVEVLRLIATGKTDREIAEALVIAGSTVRRHVNNIYAKIGLNNRAEATRYAIRQGLIPMIDHAPDL